MLTKVILALFLSTASAQEIVPEEDAAEMMTIHWDKVHVDRMAQMGKAVDQAQRDLDGKVPGEWKNKVDAYNRHMTPSATAWGNTPEVKAVGEHLDFIGKSQAA